MNAEEAARYIGCSARTVLRHVAKGTITAKRRHSQELSIAEDQVEKLKTILARDVVSVQSADTVGQLEALTDRVRTLEEKVRELESGHVRTVATTMPTMPYKRKTYEATTAYTEPLSAFSGASRIINDEDHEPSLRISTSPVPPPDIPAGSLLMADFAQLHKVPRATFSRHCSHGIRGESVETIELPKSGGRAGDKERWLSPGQQEAALHFWKRQKVKYYLCARADCACNIL